MTFKVGDRVRLTCKFAYGTLGTVVAIPFPCVYPPLKDTYFVRRDPAGPTDCLRYHKDELELVKEEPVKTPHKHAELIKAWADGAQIQHKRGAGWADCDPTWVSHAEYRIKPEPKPDMVKKCHVKITDQNYTGVGLCHWDVHGYGNVQFTFDGETGKLKAVELIK